MKSLGVVVPMALACASCVGGMDVENYEAGYSGDFLELEWTHRWEPVQFALAYKTGQGRFETLTLRVAPHRVGEELPIDGRSVIATYEHGGMGTCSRPHRVEGSLQLVEVPPAYARVRLKAAPKCGDEPQLVFCGDYTFEFTKKPRDR